MHPAGLFRRKISQHAGEPWEGNNVPLKAELVRVTQEWRSLESTAQSIAGSHSKCPCPVTFDDSEAGAAIDAAMKQEEANAQMEILRIFVGISVGGWVRHEGYDDAVVQAAEMKEQAIAYAENEAERDLTVRHWPFDDHDEAE